MTVNRKVNMKIFVKIKSFMILNLLLLALVPVGKCNFKQILMVGINRNKKGEVFLELF